MGSALQLVHISASILASPDILCVSQNCCATPSSGGTASHTYILRQDLVTAHVDSSCVLTTSAKQQIVGTYIPAQHAVQPSLIT